MRVIIKACFLLVTVPHVVGSQQLCPRSRIPLLVEAKGSPVIIKGLELAIGSSGAGGALYLGSTAAQPIVRISVLAELLDKNGEYNFAIAFSAAIRGKALNEAYVRGSEQLLDSPVEPAMDFHIAGGTQLTTRECPVKARIAAMDVWFSDGPEYHYSATGWRTSAAIRKVRALETRSISTKLPLQVLVDVTVDAEGKASNVAAQHEDHSVETWFQAQLAQWSFYPALNVVIPVESRLLLLFRLHKFPEGLESTRLERNAYPESRPVVLVDVYPRMDLTLNDQTILVAGTPFGP